MNTTRIPDEIKTVNLSAGGDAEIDTKGLDCMLCADGGDIYVALEKDAKDDRKFPVKNGTCLEFCGRVYVFAKTSAAVSCLFYRTLKNQSPPLRGRTKCHGKEKRMTQKRNLAYLKKRILCCLDEYGTDGEELYLTDGNKFVLSERMADAVTAAMVRMYESLPMPNHEYISYVMDGEKFEGANLLFGDGRKGFSLPGDFGKLVCVITRNGTKLGYGDVSVCGAIGFIDGSICGDGEKVTVVYKKCVPNIDDSTDDSFEFDLEPLAFEALVCLASAELCREEDSALYARLIYKYKDLCEGFYQIESGARRRNGFFTSPKRTSGVR